MKPIKQTMDKPTYLRKEAISALEQDLVWDLVVIGGGATGLGIALEACMRGYRTLLVEQLDFAKGTSSKSTKLVHGGVRYLANGEFKLVREASIERGMLCKNAPHLVTNQAFIIPIYTLWEKIKYGIGLKCYDWIAGKWSLGASHLISRELTLKALPGINQKNLMGGVVYHDGQFDDARLALNLAQTIWDKGGYAINYMAVTQLLKSNDNQVSGVKLQDQETGRLYEVQARAVVNATGVFADDILKMDNSNSKPLLSVSQGIHLVLDRKFLPTDSALMIPKTSDGRVLFVVPWHGKLILGTTDTPVLETSLEPIAIESEIDFILDTAASYLVQKPGRAHVLSVFAGLRPLAAPQNEGKKTKEISRSHKIIVSATGLFTIIGGKWTTYRKMGEDMVDKMEEQFEWKTTKTGTKSLPIHGYVPSQEQNDPFYFYGADAGKIRMLQEKNTTDWLSPILKIHEAQVVFAVHHEMARTLEDLLARRTRALLLDAKESLRIARSVAEIMARELGNDSLWVDEQVQSYTGLVKKYTLN